MKELWRLFHKLWGEAHDKQYNKSEWIKMQRELEKLGTWQPIATAPKDGTEILVGVDIATVWIVRNARYVRHDEWVGDIDGEDVDGWWSYQNSVTQELLEGVFEPKWWLPMTEPPERRC